jgi:hypothetical protein
MYDPSLMIAPNVGGMIQQGIEQGQQARQQNMAKGAMAALVRDPTNQRALEALASVDPQAAMQFKQQQQQQAMSGLEQHRDAIKIGAQIIRQINPKDQPSWDAALSAARQYGIDPDSIGVPRQFQPQYVQQIVSLADALDPQRPQQDRIITPQPGGGAWSLSADGTLKPLIQPNDGSAPAGAPAPLTDEQMRAMEGGQSAGPAGTFPR